MAICPHKADTEYSNAICALRYRNAQLEKCDNPRLKPGFKDPFCKSCLIGKGFNENKTMDEIEEEDTIRISQARSINENSNIYIDSSYEYRIDNISLYPVINAKGRNTNAPRLANNKGEIVAKVCCRCLTAKWLSDFFNKENPSMCKKCANKPVKKKKFTIVEDKEFIRTVKHKTCDEKEQKDKPTLETKEIIIPKEDKPALETKENITNEEDKNNKSNKEKVIKIVNDSIDSKLMNIEKTIIETIEKQFNELKKKILFEIGTALLEEAKK